MAPVTDVEAKPTWTAALKAAAKLAREYADERQADGDPEGAGVIRDLAAAILRIKAPK